MSRKYLVVERLIAVVALPGRELRRVLSDITGSRRLAHHIRIVQGPTSFRLRKPFQNLVESRYSLNIIHYTTGK